MMGSQFLAVLLALCMLMSGTGDLAGEIAAPAVKTAAVETVNQPQVGDEVYGFVAKAQRDYAMIGAKVTWFEHQKTGAQLLYVANKDTNRVFQISFNTRAIDQTGLPHVFEHSTLSGSEKYPSASLFMNLAYQTYNTYMNAYTTDALTGYPVASLSEKQLLKYADFYTDSCLHPNILKDESIYRTEAWRYRMESMDADLTYEGTVYTEMLGANTLERQAGLNAYQDIYPGSVMGNSYGGDPDEIPNMTWEALKAYHAAFYHPSNAQVILYGQYEDYAAFLQLLDEAFAPYEKADFHFEDSGYTRLTAPNVRKVPFPAAQDSATANQSTIEYYILLPGMQGDTESQRVMDTMAWLLNSASSVLMQNLKKALPTGTFGMGRELAGPEDAFVFMAVRVNEDDAALFKETVDASLRDIAAQGFPQDMVDSVMAAQSLESKLAPESGDPVDEVSQIAYAFATSGNAFERMESIDAIDRMDQWNRDGAFQACIEKWLLDKDLYSLTTTYPVAGLKEEKAAQLKEKLAAVKAAMTDEEKQAVIDATNAAPVQDDASALVARLQAVTVESLPEEIKTYDIADTTDSDGVRRIDAVAGVDGIGTVMLYLDAQALPQEELHYMRLFTHLLGELDTDAHSYEELPTLMTRYLYKNQSGVAVTGSGDNYHPYMVMQWTSTDHDLAAGYDLVEELLFHTQFTDTAKLLDRVKAIKANKRSTISASPYEVSLFRGLAVDMLMWRYYTYLNQLDYYAFLEKTEQQLQENPDEVVERLQKVQRFFMNRTGAVSAFAGNQDSILLNRTLADQFLAKLDDTKREAAVYDLPVPARREAVITDTNIQFNSVIASLKALHTDACDAALNVVASLAVDRFLIPILRDQNGVYTPLNGVMANRGMYLISYRDPKIRETFDVYEGLPEMIGNAEVTQDVLNGYILNNYSELAKGSGELTGAVAAIGSIIDGQPQDKDLTAMRQLKATTPETVKAAAEYYRLAWENGVHATAGNAAAILENADLYDAILNPFGVQETGKAELTDVQEGDALSEIIGFMLENGLMKAASDDAFGVDAQATAGDLYGALYVLVGGPSCDAQEAYSFMAQNGLVAEGVAVDTLLTAELDSQIFTAVISAAAGAPWSPDMGGAAADAPVTRGELARHLDALLTDLGLK